MRIPSTLAALVSALLGVSAQAPDPLLISPDVHTDRSVTFRFDAPNVRAVLLALEGSDRRAMQKDDRCGAAVSRRSSRCCVRSARP